MTRSEYSKVRPGPVGAEELSRLAGQMATKLKGGLAIGAAVYALSVESKNRRVAAALKQVKAALDRGATLAEAMREQPDVFDEVFVGIVAGGEANRRLAQEMQTLSAYLAATARISDGLRSAVVRPLKYVGLMLLAYLVVVALASPVVQGMLQESEGELGTGTRVAIEAASVIRSVLPCLLAFIAIAWVVLRRAARRRRVVLWRDKLLLGMPVLGGLNRMRAVADFTRTTGAMVSAGLPVMEAMQAAARKSGNLVVRGAILYEAGKLAKGRDVPGVLTEGGLVPRSELNALRTAERRGELGDLLTRLAAASDSELARRIGLLRSAVQSSTILLMGLLIAAAALALFVPAFIEH